MVEDSSGDVLHYAHADATGTLKHYHKLIWLKEQGRAFFGRIPLNRADAIA